MKTFFLPLFLGLLLLSLPACRHDDPEPIPCDNTMFGEPIAATGLDSTLCKASCICKEFTSKNFDEAQLAGLRSWNLTAPMDTLSANPYDTEPPLSSPSVCAVVVEDLANRLYHLESFASVQDAEDAGAILTHHDACGLCSTLQDFAVYAENRDLGTPVRQCGLLNFSKPLDSLIACIEGLGFSHPCAQIWAYNTRNTQAHCLQYCLDMSMPYNNPDGTLNPCLECDEVNSGPVFKSIAGRTRRNTGLASSICRFCEEVQAVAHDYPQ